MGKVKGNVVGTDVPAAVDSSALSTAAQIAVTGGSVPGLTLGIFVTMTMGKGGHSGSVLFTGSAWSVSSS